MKKLFCLVACLSAVLMVSAVLAMAAASGSSKKDLKATGKITAHPARHDCGSCHSFTKNEAENLLKDFGEVQDVKPAPVKGLYEVTIRQGNRQAVIYVDYGKKLLLPTPIFDIASKRPVSPPPVELPVIIPQADLDRIPRDNSIVMGKRDGALKLFVFTDPECPFCNKLHQELKRLVTLEPELTVYIKMFPLTNIHPKAYDKARVILGSNSLELLEKALARQELPPPGEKDRKEPVDESMRIAESLGIRGTPAIIFPDGRLVSGAMKAEAIRDLLKPAKDKK